MWPAECQYRKWHNAAAYSGQEPNAVVVFSGPVCVLADWLAIASPTQAAASRLCKRRGCRLQNGSIQLMNIQIAPCP